MYATAHYMNHQTKRSGSTASPEPMNAIQCDLRRTKLSSNAPHRLKKHSWRTNHTVQDHSIPVCLGDIVPDPGGALERTPGLSPRAFWHFYHAADGPDDPVGKHMGSKWGEIWTSYLVSDPLVLSGAVPLVLQKKAQLTQTNENASIRVAETRALQLLQERLRTLDPASVGGLVIAVCGRVQIAIQEQDLNAAFIHLKALKGLLEIHTPNDAEWMCSAWSDLRVVSSTGDPPVLKRFVPHVWRADQSRAVPPATKTQHFAFRNARALKSCVGSHFSLIYSILQRLHKLEVGDSVDSPVPNVPIQQLYETTYECCLLHAHAQRGPYSEFASEQLELLAICLKLCAWEKASHCIPRGGEIERALLQRASHILEGVQVSLLFKSGASSNAIVWLLFTLAATATVFAPESLGNWVTRLKAVTQLSSPSTFKRALDGWPTAPWWHTRALHVICNRIKPMKGDWQVLETEQDGAANLQVGMRLKLLVIEH